MSEEDARSLVEHRRRLRQLRTLARPPMTKLGATGSIILRSRPTELRLSPTLATVVWMRVR
jgi:hypothetical protein